ncbi:unnamed protein product, partial [Staurois parvus]
SGDQWRDWQRGVENTEWRPVEGLAQRGGGCTEWRSVRDWQRGMEDTEWRPVEGLAERGGGTEWRSVEGLAERDGGH